MVEYGHYGQKIRVPLLGEVSVAVSEPDVRSF
jgi:hypothetical protein